MSQNKVTFGLEKLHIAFFDDTTSGYKTPKPIPGAVGWTPEAQGETTTFYADNKAYFVLTSNNGYTGDLESALIPDDILAEMLGWIIDDNGALIEVADAMPKKFALMGQVQGDKRNRRFVYWDCQAARPSKERTTQGESVEVATDTLPLTISPIEIDGRKVVKGDMELSDTNATAFNSFFTTVYKPVITPTEGGE